MMNKNRFNLFFMLHVRSGVIYETVHCIIRPKISLFYFWALIEAFNAFEMVFQYFR